VNAPFNATAVVPTHALSPPALQRCSAQSELLAANSRNIWNLIAGLLVITAAACWAAGISPSWATIGRCADCLLILTATSYCYRKLRPDAHVAFCTEGLAQVGLILWLGCVLSYAAATIGAPYRDSALDAADVWIGLDWRAYLHFLNRHRALGIVCAVAYRSVVPQMVALFVVLAATSRFLRMQQYILATAIALAVTLVIFIFVPAVGTYSFFGIQPHEYSNLYPIIVASFDDVRSGQLVTIEVLEGLIAFPSFHTVWAILFMWAFYPFTSLRLGAILLNLLVIASTPVGGSHYFVDIVGGTIVALVAVSAATRLFPDRFR
jgi:hypothetical protein